jgi:hypothetical protein
LGWWYYPRLDEDIRRVILIIFWSNPVSRSFGSHLLEVVLYVSSDTAQILGADCAIHFGRPFTLAYCLYWAPVWLGADALSTICGRFWLFSVVPGWCNSFSGNRPDYSKALEAVIVALIKERL